MLLTTRQTILALLARTAPAGFTRPADWNTLNVGLFTTLPADDGTGGVEAAGSNYARVAIAALDANFGIAGDLVTNVAEIQFGLLTGSIGEIVGFGIWDNGGVLRHAQPAGDLPQAFTFDAGTDVFTRAAHGLLDKQMIRGFSLDGLALPGNIAANTTYFVRDGAAGSLKAAATEAGAAIDLTTTGAVLLRRWYGKSYGVDDRPVIPAGALKIKLAV